MAYIEILNELNELYNYFLEIDKFKGVLKSPMSYTANAKEVILRTNTINPFTYSRFTTFLINYYQKTSLPQIFDDDIYETITTPPIYRGEKTACFAKNLIADLNYHTGGGTFGDGIYITAVKSYASIYGNEYANNKGVLVEYKLAPNTLIVNYEVLKQLKQIIKSQLELKKRQPIEDIDIINKEKFIALIEYLKIKNNVDFNECFLSRHSNSLAIYLGYDALYAHQNFIVFNRNKLCLSESEQNRIIKLAQKEKNNQHSLSMNEDNVEYNR